MHVGRFPVRLLSRLELDAGATFRDWGRHVGSCPVVVVAEEWAGPRF